MGFYYEKMWEPSRTTPNEVVLLSTGTYKKVRIPVLIREIAHDCMAIILQSLSSSFHPLSMI